MAGTRTYYGDAPASYRRWWIAPPWGGVMAGTRTYYGDAPASYRRWWLENGYPVRAAQIGGSTNGGSILDIPTDIDTDELRRVRRFGACWDWWRVPKDLQQQWRDLDG